MLEGTLKDRFVKARRQYIEGEYSFLNDMQRQAVMTTQGPLLILAGAGSGKTTVLINRIGNIIKYGQGSDSTEVPEDVTEDDLCFLEDFLNGKSSDKERADNKCSNQRKTNRRLCWYKHSECCYNRFRQQCC